MKDHKCDRCSASLTDKASSMSMFNTDVLCWDCVEKEQAHKLYGYACREERRAVAQGDRNYKGIGKPEDL
jgi:hypothetical protein